MITAPGDSETSPPALPATAGELLGISERTAKRTRAYARAWLFEELSRRR